MRGDIFDQRADAGVKQLRNREVGPNDNMPGVFPADIEVVLVIPGPRDPRDTNRTYWERQSRLLTEWLAHEKMRAEWLRHQQENEE